MISSTVFRCFGSIRVTTYSISSNCGTHIITAGTGTYAGNRNSCSISPRRGLSSADTPSMLNSPDRPAVKVIGIARIALRKHAVEIHDLRENSFQAECVK